MCPSISIDAAWTPSERAPTRAGAGRGRPGKGIPQERPSGWLGASPGRTGGPGTVSLTRRAAGAPDRADSGVDGCRGGGAEAGTGIGWRPVEAAPRRSRPRRRGRDPYGPGVPRRPFSPLALLGRPWCSAPGLGFPTRRASLPLTLYISQAPGRSATHALAGRGLRRTAASPGEWGGAAEEGQRRSG